jgi:hypothetical protein
MRGRHIILVVVATTMGSFSAGYGVADVASRTVPFARRDARVDHACLVAASILKGTDEPRKALSYELPVIELCTGRFLDMQARATADPDSIDALVEEMRRGR